MVAASDYLAIGALNAAYTLGVKVPEDVSIVGFDDLPLTEFTVPSLTTVHMPIAEMTALAIRLAIEQEAMPPLEKQILRPTLVIRKSSGPAPRP